MTRITGEIVIDAPAGVVFDFVADQQTVITPGLLEAAAVAGAATCQRAHALTGSAGSSDTTRRAVTTGSRRRG